MAHWKTDTELVKLFGKGWVYDLDVSCDADFYEAKAWMLDEANKWLAANSKQGRVLDCADAGCEMLWLLKLDKQGKRRYNTHTKQTERAMSKVYFNTNGKGLWSRARCAVGIEDMRLGYLDDDENPEFGELRVYFDSDSWDTRPCGYGLIYTDPQFLRELREFLKQHGLAGNDVDYSEQGMQGIDYVSCDVGEKFLNSWKKKFGTLEVDGW